MTIAPSTAARLNELSIAETLSRGSSENAAGVSTFVDVRAFSGDLLNPPKGIEVAMACVRVGPRLVVEAGRAPVRLGLAAVLERQTEKLIDRARVDVGRRHAACIAHRPQGLASERDDFLANEVDHPAIDVAVEIVAGFIVRWLGPRHTCSDRALIVQASVRRTLRSKWEVPNPGSPRLVAPHASLTARVSGRALHRSAPTEWWTAP